MRPSGVHDEISTKRWGLNGMPTPEPTGCPAVRWPSSTSPWPCWPNPQVLLLDEPYAGFDWDTYLKFWDLMSHRREAGRAVLIISHFVTDEHRFDRIVKLCDGQLCEGRTVPQ